MNPIPYAYFAIILVAIQDYLWRVYVQLHELQHRDSPNKEDLENVIAMEIRARYLLTQFSDRGSELHAAITKSLEDIIPSEMEELINDSIKKYWEVRNRSLDS